MKNILITGVTGFVGKNLVQHFTDRGNFKIYGHSRTPGNHNGPDNKVSFVPGYSSAQLNELNIDAFVHLAGIAHDLSNQFTTQDYYRVNYEGTKKAVDEFLQSKAQKFIFVSSIKAVCDVSSLPADEQMTPAPKTDYGKSKLKAEEYIRSIASKTSKQFFILRPAMMHGPGNKGNLNLLYRFAKTGLPFPFGAFRNHRSFHSIRNFNAVVQAIIEKNIVPGTYHLADDGFLSTTELYKLIGEAIGIKTRVMNLPPSLINMLATSVGKKDTVRKLTEDMVVSNTKIVKALGSSLPVSLKEGLIQTIQSFDLK